LKIAIAYLLGAYTRAVALEYEAMSAHRGDCVFVAERALRLSYLLLLEDEPEDDGAERAAKEAREGAALSGGGDAAAAAAAAAAARATSSTPPLLKAEGVVTHTIAAFAGMMRDPA
jgi:hypothetical protein